MNNITTLQYNIFARAMLRDKQSLRLPKVKEFITKLQERKRKTIDVITFCEANAKKSTDRMIHDLQSMGFTHHTKVLGRKLSTTTSSVLKTYSPYRLSPANGGVLIMSRHPIVYEYDHVFKHCQEWMHQMNPLSKEESSADCLAQKGFIFCKIKIPSSKKENKY